MVRHRTAARLAAVQALYQIEIAGASVEQVLRDCLHHGISTHALVDDPDIGNEVAIDLVKPDTDLLSALVRGVSGRQADIDSLIIESLAPGWRPERLEAVVRSILRAGIWELQERAETPPRVIISEYVDVARAFYDGPETGLVNAVLDRLARSLRPEELHRR
ncbi:MAG: transcription antitermination factor NusB [Alphaproteobacteria bacterium]|nr:transcription antitermination factor NusB [Alphaproteobacteria bacterium]